MNKNGNKKTSSKLLFICFQVRFMLATRGTSNLSKHKVSARAVFLVINFHKSILPINVHYRDKLSTSDTLHSS